MMPQLNLIMSIPVGDTLLLDVDLTIHCLSTCVGIYVKGGAWHWERKAKEAKNKKRKR